MRSVHFHWKPQVIDLGLAVAIAFLFPVLAGLIFGASGALLPMLLYYGLAWGLVKWRRGSSGYSNSWPKKITPFFYINLGVILGSLALAYLARARTVNVAPRMVLAELEAATKA